MTDSTERFGDRASAYAAHRPGYPPEAIDAVFAGLGDPTDLTVVDIGAGTGISSRLLADRGAHVIAVEPNAKMRGEAGLHPRIEWRDGTGEASGLPYACADMVTAFQAFHWFATPAGLTEMRRLARRRAVLVQYERDETDPFTSAIGKIIEHHALDDTEDRRQDALKMFAKFPGARVTRSEFRQVQHVDLDGLLGRIASSSYLPKSGDPHKAMLRDLNAAYGRFSGPDGIDYVMVVYVIVASFEGA